MTRDKAAKKAARQRAAETGESYTRARRTAGTRPAARAALDGPGAADLEDQAQWWRAYVLAEDDRVDELRRLAEAGDGHARGQLASWLADRRQTDEAITVIRPLADAGDDVARLWLARWLAERDEVDELRRRAGTGDPHALYHLAGWLAEEGCLDELRELLTDHRELLAASWAPAYAQHQLDVLRLRADLGDDQARQLLARRLARMRQEK